LPPIDRVTLKEYNTFTSNREGKNLADELLTIDQVAAELQLHPDTIRRYIRQGKLKQTKIGGTAVRIRRSELDRFIREGEEDSEDKKD
jgi:excisionase family DNA binding protein